MQVDLEDQEINLIKLTMGELGYLLTGNQLWFIAGPDAIREMVTATRKNLGLDEDGQKTDGLTKTLVDVSALRHHLVMTQVQARGHGNDARFVTKRREQ